MSKNETQIHPRLRALINPAILAQVEQTIAAKEDAEASNPYLYRRYLETHADHILSQAVTRGAGNHETAAA